MYPPFPGHMQISGFRPSVNEIRSMKFSYSRLFEIEELRDLVILELGAYYDKLSCVACRAFSDLVLARNVVEVEPFAVRRLHDALCSENSAAHSEIEFLERIVELLLGVFSRCLSAPCREYLVSIVVVVAVIMVVFVMIVMMLVLVIVLVIVIVMMVVFIMVMFVFMIVFIMVMVMVVMFVNRFFCELLKQLLLERFVAFHGFENCVA